MRTVSGATPRRATSRAAPTASVGRGLARRHEGHRGRRRGRQAPRSPSAAPATRPPADASTSTSRPPIAAASACASAEAFWDGIQVRRDAVNLADADASTPRARTLTPDDATVDLPLGAVCPASATSSSMRSIARRRHGRAAQRGGRSRRRPRAVVQVVDWHGHVAEWTADHDDPQQPGPRRRQPSAEHRHERHQPTSGSTNNGSPARAASPAPRRSQLQHAAPVGRARPTSRSRSPRASRSCGPTSATGSRGRLTCVINGKRKSAPEARSHRPAQQGRQEDARQVRHDGRRQGQLLDHPVLPQLAHADLPLHQHGRQAVAGEHQDQGREARRRRSLALSEIGAREEW